MASYIIIACVALLVSALTFFSGFGLGTLLMPAFALFFPLESAIALTAVVHLLNNLFKLTLIGRKADWGTVIAFGLPAALAAMLGASLLVWLTGLQPLYSYQWLGRSFSVTALDISIAVLIMFFALMDIFKWMPPLQKSVFSLPLGGMLSGFFGGLSGHQGALRSAVLVKFNLGKEAFIATGVVIAVIIDVARLFVYSSRFKPELYMDNAPLLVTAVLAAFSGAFIGNRLLKKMTIGSVRYVVAAMLILISLALMAGLI
ncbi:MAG TPA: sulfite exporter TauE/SafE family protein [Caldithrix abyssi]|uniref:Probable membrane transporter protein n=1 Tax=Caldithrix abyssi TaxID=187145 RepID=A0A7V1LL10_CALAY|nr:sulfite exporter TauE/SafE family protein [Caldithrix abyssi]